MANPKILGILTFVIILISGFFALKNKQAYESEINQTAVEDQNLQISRKRLQDAQDALAATISQREGVEGEIAKLQTQEADQKKLNQDLKGELEDKIAQVGDFDGSPENMRLHAEKVDRLRQTVTKLVQLKADIEQLDKDIADREARLAQLNSDNDNVEKQIAAMRSDMDQRSSGRSFAHLKTKIRSVYPTWGFVTLAHGDAGGVVLNSTLDVVRNGEPVAKLFVSTVERNSASASIVPGSMQDDVVLMTGDQVVPSKFEAPPALPEPAPLPEAGPLGEVDPLVEPAAPADAAPADAAPADAAPADAEPADALPF